MLATVPLVSIFMGNGYNLAKEHRLRVLMVSVAHGAKKFTPQKRQAR